MSDSPATRVYPCRSVDEFFAKLRPPASPFEGGVTNSVLYRGVGDSRYELVPAALRTDKRSQETVDRIKSLAGESSHIVDVTVLSMFYREANRNGLALPYLSQYMHELLCNGEVSPDFAAHAHGAMLPVLGLAQHYGLPTKLLDWSFDPLVAAYFAAENGTRHLQEAVSNSQDRVEDKTSELAVWFVQSRFLGADVRVVHAPYSGNPNLAAQKGAFTFVNDIDDDTPLNAVYASQTTRRDFHKVTLPISEAATLLFELRLRGYDAARLFPGYSGVSQAVKELASLAQFPQVTKRVFE